MTPFIQRLASSWLVSDCIAAVDLVLLFLKLIVNSIALNWVIDPDMNRIPSFSCYIIYSFGLGRNSSTTRYLNVLTIKREKSLSETVVWYYGLS